MSVLRDTLIIARNELRLEGRTKEILFTTSMFSLLMAVVSSLAFYLDRVSVLAIAPGILWLALSFSGILAMSRSWLREGEWHVIDALLLSPISRAALYAGKAIAALILLLLNATILTCFVTILCHLSPFISENPARNIGFMAIFILAGLIGFVAPGTLFASMSVRTKIRELTLSIILFPLCAPALLVGVVATRELFVGAPDLELWNWLRVLVAFDLVVVAICPMLFERLFSSRS